MAPIDDALATIEALKPGEKLVYQAFADKYGVDRSTLPRRHKRVQLPLEIKNLNQQKLTPQQDEELFGYTEYFTETHCPPTRQIIINFATPLCSWEPSDRWVSRLIH
ncbi:uncharacterized protein M421DRAFT_18414, partial [Didymella exigua CBS 183.55]